MDAATRRENPRIHRQGNILTVDIVRLLKKHCGKAIESMGRDRRASHSFNVINPASPTKACTMLLLFVPSRMDREIYDALKPIFDRELGPGTLVEPGKEAARAVRGDA